MQSTPNLESLIPLPENMTKLAYETLQQGKSLFGLSHKNISSLLKKNFVPKTQQGIQPLSQETQLKLIEKRNQLLETDWQDSQQGIYPVSMLFDNPWEDFIRYYPEIWLDIITKQLPRLQKQEYQNFAPQIDQESYPSYYLQNFHYQTDGYLSDMSANLYDLQVEILFNGAADAMRRRILAPLKVGCTQITPQKLVKVLDAACGTGRTLRFIRATLPKASLYGVDLSPAYLRKANQLLSELPGELPQLAQANGEELPYLDNYFDAVTSVFLFHELPSQVRQQVIEECFRVTKPGGIFIICDSMQEDDSPEFRTIMANFTLMFHEPYYKNYINDNLVERLEKAGFENIKIQNHFVSKYWIAHKPKAE